MIESFIVDSFTDTLFKGNPAGVCLLDNPIEENLMQNIAIEFGFSETAFVVTNQEEAHASIRYFSPKQEIPLCGHATLAAAKIIFKKLDLPEITFKTIEDQTLIVKNEDPWIVMNFPTYGLEKIEPPKKMMEVLGIEKAISSLYNKETNIIMLEVENEDVLNGFSPDFVALEKSYEGIDALSLTSRSSDPAYDFKSRLFWPWSGTDEDPVTGGSHTFLTPYWSKKLSKKKLKSYQASERSGFMEVELLDNDRFLIRGLAQIVLEGRLNL